MNIPAGDFAAVEAALTSQLAFFRGATRSWNAQPGNPQIAIPADNLDQADKHEAYAAATAANPA